MLGVGQDVNETSGWSTGVKISLFDVSDPEAPVEVTSLVDTGKCFDLGCAELLYQLTI